MVVVVGVFKLNGDVCVLACQTLKLTIQTPMLTLWPLMKAKTMRMIVISDVFKDLICVQF